MSLTEWVQMMKSKPCSDRMFWDPEMGEYCRLNNGPQSWSDPKPQTSEYVNFSGKKDFMDVIKLRILQWGHHPGYLCRANVMTSILLPGRQEG